MKLEPRKISGREKDEASIKHLEQLRFRLYDYDVSNARRTAFNLSWMQEDGLDVLKEALFGTAGRSTKSAAAYGLRRMHGRMKKPARELLTQGLESQNRDTIEVCKNAIWLAEGGKPKKFTDRRRSRERKFGPREGIRRGIAINEIRRRPRVTHRTPESRHIIQGEDYSRRAPRRR